MPAFVEIAVLLPLFFYSFNPLPYGWFFPCVVRVSCLLRLGLFEDRNLL